MAQLTTESVAAKPETETRPAVNHVAAFAAKAQPADLAPEIRQLDVSSLTKLRNNALAAVKVPGHSLCDQVSRRTHVGGGSNDPILPGGEPHEVASGPHVANT